MIVKSEQHVELKKRGGGPGGMTVGACVWGVVEKTADSLLFSPTHVNKTWCVGTQWANKCV